MAIGLGSGNPFPLMLGGGDSVEDVELEALLDAYAPAWDRAEDSANYAECLACAQLIAMVWAANERLRNQTVPERMLDVVTDWESILKLKPAPSDTDFDRRSRISSALRGLAGNTLTDINDVCATLLGSNFDELVFQDEAETITYWPGVNPGPPGFEWMSTRLKLGVRINQGRLGIAEFSDKVNALSRTLDLMLPSWMTYAIGIGDGFVCDDGICDLTFL